MGLDSLEIFIREIGAGVVDWFVVGVINAGEKKYLVMFCDIQTALPLLVRQDHIAV